MSAVMQSEIVALKQALSVNAFDYDSFFRLINLLKTANEHAESADECLRDLENHRALFAARFLPDTKFWIDWIQDKILNAGAACADLIELDELFQNAIFYCPNIEIVTEWVENSSHRYEGCLLTEEVLRVTVEKAISICGADIMHGADLWKRLIDIQIETLDDLIDTGSSSDVIKGAKEAIVSTYRRQFALPLLGNQRSLSSFETLLSDICIESDAQWIRPEILLEKFQRSEEQLAARIIYEQNVLSEEFLLSPITDQVSAWRAYINFEIAEKELQRAHRLYERSLLTCHQSLDLWTEYADFAATTFKQWSLVESVSGRAIKVHRSSINLWLQNLVAIESIGCMSLPSFPSVKEKDFDFSCLIPKLDQFASMKEIPVSETAEKMVKAVQTALTCSFYSAEDYLSILLYFCDFRRRELRSHLSAATHILEETGTLGCETAQKIRETIIFGIKLLRKSFSDAEGFLEMCYPEWGSGWLSLYKYQVSVEDEIISDALELLENNELFRFDGEGKEMNIRSQDDDENHDISSKASEVWERAILRFNKYYFAWGEYIQWGRSAGDFHLCRCLYGRALKSVKDFPEELCKAFLSFEQQVGTLQDYCTAKSRTKTIMKNAAAKANKATLLAKETAKIKNQKKAQKEAEVAGNYSAPKSAGIIPLVSVSSSQSVKKNSIQDQDLPNHNSSTIQNDSISIGHERQKRTLDEDISGINTSENDHNILESSKKKPKMEDSSKLLTMTVPIKNGDIETTKISVKNLSFKSSIEEILEHFKFCGEILGSELLLSKAGKSRGQAIIEFSHHSSIIEAMKLNGSLLSERSIEIELIPFLCSDSSTANASSSSSKAPSSHHPTTVFVSKFSKDLTSDQLRELFKECGDIFEARVIVDKRTGQSKCHGLVQFYEESGKRAALCLNKREINGQIISVLPSKFGAVAEGNSIYGPSTVVGNKKEQMIKNSEESNKISPIVSQKKSLQFRPRKLAIQMKP